MAGGKQPPACPCAGQTVGLGQGAHHHRIPALDQIEDIGRVFLLIGKLGIGLIHHQHDIRRQGVAQANDLALGISVPVGLPGLHRNTIRVCGVTAARILPTDSVKSTS